MIVVQLAGGLGNQMFQYANARGCQRTPQEKIVLDTYLLKELESDIEKIIQRPYSLSVFKKLKAESKVFNLKEVLIGNSFLRRIKRKISKAYTAYVTQFENSPVSVITSKKPNIFLAGNFQSELNFINIRKEIIEEFEFPKMDSTNERIKEHILSTNDALSIHIRRGDYLSSANSNIYASVNINYYKNAIDVLLNKLGLRQIETFVFTDDIDWVRQNFNDDRLKVNFIEGNIGENSWKDMCLMSCCKHHIIANSTFSWWGAWLSQNSGGFNLAPKHWFLPNTLSYQIENIIPKSWTIIDYNL